MANGKALAIPVPGPGRRSLYREAFVDQAFKLCLLGASDEELANFFEVGVRTIYNWKDEHAAFLQATIDGKIKADAEVAHSLYRAATGHETTLEKVVKNRDGVFEAVRYKSFVPADPNAAYKWLCNRRRQSWADKQIHEHTGNITIDHRAAAKAEMSELFGERPEIIIESING
jgi:hypothetical protein